MSMIAIVVKAALSLDQKVQGLKAKGAHYFASSNFAAAVQADDQALIDAETSAIAAERFRAKRAAELHAQFKDALNKLHIGVDLELDLIDGRKQQALAKGHQYRSNAAVWQGTSIAAQVAAENARRASEQLS